jgi:hypothetical protein
MVSEICKMKSSYYQPSDDQDQVETRDAMAGMFVLGFCSCVSTMVREKPLLPLAYED